MKRAWYLLTNTRFLAHSCDNSDNYDKVLLHVKNGKFICYNCKFYIPSILGVNTKYSEPLLMDNFKAKVIQLDLTRYEKPLDE